MAILSLPVLVQLFPLVQLLPAEAAPVQHVARGR